MVGFLRWLGGGSTGAGQREEGEQLGIPAGYTAAAATPVTLDSSLQLSAVWACVKLIAEAVGSMPVNVYERKSSGELALATDHPLQRMFMGKMNSWQTRQEFFETLTYQLALMGNCYSMKGTNPRGELVSLTPLMSNQMRVFLTDGGSKAFEYSESNETKEYTDRQIWHTPLFGNGLVGLSALGFARNSIGISQGAEDATTKIYQNGGKPSGILSIDKVLKPEQRKAVRENFQDLTEGADHRLLTLEAGMKFHATSLSPQDIELLSSRRFQIEDIARFFGVPSVLINDSNAGTTWGSGIEQIIQGFYKFGLRPYLQRYEAGMKCWLLPPQDRLKFEIKFDFNSLLMPDEADRLKSHKEAITSGQLTPNEARKKEGKPPLEGGDSLYMQQQMTPIEYLPIKGAVSEKDKTED